MFWEMLLLALLWIAIGFGVSYLYGRFAYGGDHPGLYRDRPSFVLHVWRSAETDAHSRPPLTARSVGNLAELTYSPPDR